jgi:regulator of cell morphogenesis and NO signaling
MYQTSNIYLTPDLKMSGIIQNNPYLLLLLEHFGIDVPLQEKTIMKVCSEVKLSTELFLTFANLYNGVEYNPTTPVSINDTNSIINYLKNSHKFYSEEMYPNILSTIKQMAKVNSYKEMALVEKFFIDYFTEVSEHLAYENKVVFPYILTLYEQIESLKILEKTNYSVKEYKDHHNDIEEKLNDLKNLLIKYLPQENDQAIRRKLLLELSELEYDLNIHSKIEDMILIPLVANMEEELKNARK